MNTSTYILSPLIQHLHQSLVLRYGYVSDDSLFSSSSAASSSSAPNTAVTPYTGTLTEGSIIPVTNCIDCALASSPGDFYLYYTGAIFYANVLAFFAGTVFLFFFLCVYGYSSCSLLCTLYRHRRQQQQQQQQGTKNGSNVDDEGTSFSTFTYTTTMNEYAFQRVGKEDVGYYGTSEYTDAYDDTTHHPYPHPSSPPPPSSSSVVIDNSIGIPSTDVEMVPSPKKRGFLSNFNGTPRSPSSSSTVRSTKTKGNTKHISVPSLANLTNPLIDSSSVSYNELPTSPSSDLAVETPFPQNQQYPPSPSPSFPSQPNENVPNKALALYPNVYDNLSYGDTLEPSAPPSSSTTSTSTSTNRRKTIPLSVRQQWKYEENDTGEYSSTIATASRRSSCCFTYRGTCMPGGYCNRRYNCWYHPRYKQRFQRLNTLITASILFTIVTISNSSLLNNYNNGTEGVLTNMQTLHDLVRTSRTSLGTLYVTTDTVYTTLNQHLYPLLIQNNAPPGVLNDYHKVNLIVNTTLFSTAAYVGATRAVQNTLYWSLSTLHGALDTGYALGIASAACYLILSVVTFLTLSHTKGHKCGFLHRFSCIVSPVIIALLVVTTILFMFPLLLISDSCANPESTLITLLQNSTKDWNYLHYGGSPLSMDNDDFGPGPVFNDDDVLVSDDDGPTDTHTTDDDASTDDDGIHYPGIIAPNNGVHYWLGVNADYYFRTCGPNANFYANESIRSSVYRNPLPVSFYSVPDNNNNPNGNGNVLALPLPLMMNQLTIELNPLIGSIQLLYRTVNTYKWTNPSAKKQILNQINTVLRDSITIMNTSSVPISNLQCTSLMNPWVNSVNGICNGKSYGYLLILISALVLCTIFSFYLWCYILYYYVLWSHPVYKELYVTYNDIPEYSDYDLDDKGQIKPWIIEPIVNDEEDMGNYQQTGDDGNGMQGNAGTGDSTGTHTVNGDTYSRSNMTNTVSSSSSSSSSTTVPFPSPSSAAVMYTVQSSYTPQSTVYTYGNSNMVSAPSYTASMHPTGPTNNNSNYSYTPSSPALYNDYTQSTSTYTPATHATLTGNVYRSNPYPGISNPTVSTLIMNPTVNNVYGNTYNGINNSSGSTGATTTTTSSTLGSGSGTYTYLSANTTTGTMMDSSRSNIYSPTMYSSNAPTNNYSSSSSTTTGLGEGDGRVIIMRENGQIQESGPVVRGTISSSNSSSSSTPNLTTRPPPFVRYYPDIDEYYPNATPTTTAYNTNPASTVWMDPLPLSPLSTTTNTTATASNRKTNAPPSTTNNLNTPGFLPLSPTDSQHTSTASVYNTPSVNPLTSPYQMNTVSSTSNQVSHGWSPFASPPSHPPVFSSSSSSSTSVYDASANSSTDPNMRWVNVPGVGLRTQYEIDQERLQYEEYATANKNSSGHTGTTKPKKDR